MSIQYYSKAITNYKDLNTKLITMDGRHTRTSQFNPRKYEDHLSPFGRKVLDTMIKKWNTDKNNTLNRNSHPYQPRLPALQLPKSKTILTAQSEERRPSQLLQYPRTATGKNTIGDEPFNFDVIVGTGGAFGPPVPTTNELLKIVEPKKDVRLDRNESLASCCKTDAENRARLMIQELLNIPDDVREYIVKKAGEKTSVPVPTVTWDDMFDDLLPEAATNAKLIIQQNSTRTTNTKTFDIAHTDTTKDNIAKAKDDKHPKKTEVKLVTHDQKAKRKYQTKVTDTIPKKVKKITEVDKPNFRKQKYTKTVKNWLNDVDPNNPVLESETPSLIEPVIYKDNDISATVNDIQTKINRNENIVIEKVIPKPNNKKVVQAQLANKDGIMKFDKPKDKQETEEPSSKMENNKSDKAKEKKVKVKFVAPIKSPVPVKEVEYKVVTVDDTNIRDHSSLCHIKNSDVIVVLVYSNGFSQLNMQYTEDSCIPEGVMVNIEEAYYHFKGAREVIAEILENNNVLCYEGKNVLRHLKSMFGLEFTNINIIDAKIGGSLIDPDDPPETFSDLQKLLSYTAEYTIATECTLQKTAWYLTLLDKCGVRLTTLLKENGLWSVFVNIEMKLIPIIAEMEYRGVKVDMQKLRSMEEILLSKMKEVEQECYKAAGKKFQINSAVQIRSIIYDELQLDSKCNVKVKETISKGEKSTSETMLKSLVSVHPLPKLIMEYRHLHKAHATFLTGIAQHVKDGVVRPTWVQTAAATGRIASNNPNLQAIPKAPFSLILFPDENNSGNQTLSIRSVYISREGWSLVAADFQHVECRVFAHCAADGALAVALQAGGDLFRTLAAKWLNKPEKEISSEDRERTKRIVYASLYGAGCRKLMDILGTTYEQTLSIIASFNRTFPSLKSFGRSVVSRCEQNGGRLSTLCGRARRFKNIGSQDFQLKAQAERQAVNFIVQGSAADLCKLAMVATYNELRARCPPGAGRLLLQIHDELVWEVMDDHVETAAAIIKEVMEGCGQQCGMSMRLPVHIYTGRTWGNMAEYTHKQQ